MFDPAVPARRIPLRERLAIVWLMWKLTKNGDRLRALDDWMDDRNPAAHEGLKAYVEQREARLQSRGEAR